MIARIEVSLQPDPTPAHPDGMKQATDVRYVVTSLEGDAERLYEGVYCQRGQAENLIKLHKAQLASDRMDDALATRGVLYAPDFVVNAGGIINVSVEFHPGGYDEKVSLGKIERIPQALKELWTIAKEDRIPPSDAADRLAERILADARGAKKATSCAIPPKGKGGTG